MNLYSITELLAGGPGSGRHPEALRPFRETRERIRRSLIKLSKEGKYAEHDDLRRKAEGQGYFFESKDLKAGGPGSGCQGPNCGRPSHGGKLKQRIERRLKKMGVKRIGKRTPGLIRRHGKLTIPLKDPWAGRVKKQYTAQEGHKITELRTPKQYEKSGKSWLQKKSPYKGQFLSDSHGAFNQTTIGDPKEKNSFWIHQESPDKGVSVEVHRNLGSLKVNVIERKLGEYGAIIDHREVSFRNVGRAMGFMNKRYGITYRLKGA